MIYKTKRWEKKREAILRRDNYECQYFKRFGKHVEATVVHHIFPVVDYPEYAFENWNLISLSQKAHNMMHERNSDTLTAVGVELQGRTRRPIEKILVCGLPGTGKTTYVKEHLGSGLAFDLDYLSSAFRLKGPKENDSEAARKIANDLLIGFANKANDYSPKVFIIRTAPTKEELDLLKPTKIILLTKVYQERNIPVGDKADRLDRVREYANIFAIPLLII